MSGGKRRVLRWPAVDAGDEHDWRAKVSPSGERGYQCVRCGLTATVLPLALKSLRSCPQFRNCK